MPACRSRLLRSYPNTLLSPALNRRGFSFARVIALPERLHRYTNIAADPEHIAEAKRFYGELFGLDLLMDLGWIATYGSKAK